MFSNEQIKGTQMFSIKFKIKIKKQTFKNIRLGKMNKIKTVEQININKTPIQINNGNKFKSGKSNIHFKTRKKCSCAFQELPNMEIKHSHCNYHHLFFFQRKIFTLY